MVELNTGLEYSACRNCIVYNDYAVFYSIIFVRTLRRLLLHRVMEERNILHTMKRRKANLIGHILRRNCLLKHVIEGKLGGRIEDRRRRERSRKQLLDGLNEKRIHWNLKEEALDRTLWRTRFGRGSGPVVRHYVMGELNQWHENNRLAQINIPAKCSLYTKGYYIGVFSHLYTFDPCEVISEGEGARGRQKYELVYWVLFVLSFKAVVFNLGYA
jgi:hypothetical protein